MASLPLAMGAVAGAGGRMFAATAAKGAKEEKSFIDWLLGNMTKDDQFYETDPILKKVEDKSSGNGTTSGRKGTVSVPAKKKNGGFGGLFAKK